MKITAEFITSAAGPADFPAEGLPEVAVVGRSNVGKSSLINALLRQRVARTSAAPGKTRLANIYRVQRGSAPPFCLVDLPGYGFARGSGRPQRQSTGGGAATAAEPAFDEVAESAFARHPAALLLLDVRHPGLDNDRAAWQWLLRATDRVGLVGTKIDKLARGQRMRALRELESVFEDSVLPVSAVTGEGMDELWKLIDRLASNRNNPSNPHNRPSIPPKGMAPRHQKK